ncbi:WecB/TagA/CpsF family glycosyltransferase [Patescibacteria group bacterium]|nr:WecB/TagA/CpsF family glycosyltransferase [Patescibacteria group bacterium]
MTPEIFGIKITAQKKDKVLEQIKQRITESRKTFVVTPYSEFFYRSFHDYEFKDILNSADIALPDGISVLWLAYYFSIPLTAKRFYIKALQAFWQLITSGLCILFRPYKIRSVVHEKISGSDFFWDLAELAHKNNYSLLLLGGFGDTSEIAAKKIAAKYPGIRVYSSNTEPDDPRTPILINNKKPDILMVAYGPVKQEKWIHKSMADLDAKIFIGLGGTFDYVAGKKSFAPKFIRDAGLEWLYRLITQPTRISRIWNGTFGLARGALREKVFSSMPLRQNVLGVIINEQGRILAAKRRSKKVNGENSNPDADHWQFPQGGVDKNESPEHAIKREILEETGIRTVEILGKAGKTNIYKWNETVRNIFFNRLKYRGQEQHIYFLRYDGNGEDVRPDNREFEEFKWVEPSELRSTIHPFRKKAVDIILENISKYL